ncbi:MAG: hypothetical protein QM817_10395 [Archangium sp.]
MSGPDQQIVADRLRECGYDEAAIKRMLFASRRGVQLMTRPYTAPTQPIFRPPRYPGQPERIEGTRTVLPGWCDRDVPSLAEIPDEYFDFSKSYERDGNGELDVEITDTGQARRRTPGT